jgi:hypothetical protein
MLFTIDNIRPQAMDFTKYLAHKENMSVKVWKTVLQSQSQREQPPYSEAGAVATRLLLRRLLLSISIYSIYKNVTNSFLPFIHQKKR